MWPGWAGQGWETSEYIDGYCITLDSANVFHVQSISSDKMTQYRKTTSPTMFKWGVKNQTIHMRLDMTFFNITTNFAIFSIADFVCYEMGL